MVLGISERAGPTPQKLRYFLLAILGSLIPPACGGTGGGGSGVGTTNADCPDGLLCGFVGADGCSAPPARRARRT